MAETVETSTSEEKIAYFVVDWLKTKGLIWWRSRCWCRCVFRKVRKRSTGGDGWNTGVEKFLLKKRVLHGTSCLLLQDRSWSTAHSTLEISFLFSPRRALLYSFYLMHVIQEYLGNGKLFHSLSLTMVQRYFTSRFLKSRRQFGALRLYTITTRWPAHPPSAICVWWIRRNALYVLCFFGRWYLLFLVQSTNFVSNPLRFHQVVFWQFV